MTDGVINSNFDDFHCILLKMVSGEELITHVDLKNMRDRKTTTIVLYDPYMILRDGSKLILSKWIHGCDDSTIIIAKTDIMVNTNPDKQYEEIYNNLIKEKYNPDYENEEDLLDDDGTTHVFQGNDSIH